MLTLKKELVQANVQIQDLQKMDRICHRVTYWKEKYSNLSTLNEELQLVDSEKVQAMLCEEIFQLEQKLRCPRHSGGTNFN